MTALIYTILIALLVAADQLTKRVVVTHMELGQTINAIPGVLDWTYILNDGASFGMMGGKTVFLIVMTCLVMAVLAFFLYSRKIHHPTGVISSILILAGGIGNCIDRIFNDGKVIDFIDIDPIFSFPKFNVADCCVTCGGVLFCVFVLFFSEDRKNRKNLAEASAADANEEPAECCTGCCVAECSEEDVPADSAAEETAETAETPINEESVVEEAAETAETPVNEEPAVEETAGEHEQA